MTASIRFTNSGENLRRTAPKPIPWSFFETFARDGGEERFETEIGMKLAAHFASSQVAGQENERALKVDGGVVA